MSTPSAAMAAQWELMKHVVSNVPSGREVIKTTCPRDCYDACGIAVIRRDGRVTRVLGDPDHHVSHGALCGKCAIAYNGVWLDSGRRLTTPLVRAGPKGTSSFEPTSWDAALSRIASRLGDIRREKGGGAITHTHYTGTCSAIAGNFPSRFFNRIGAVEVDPDSVCNKAGHVALGLIFGSSLDGFDPRTAKDARCILVWGANPSASAPHAHKHWLFESEAKCIVVDPVRHGTAAKAHLHLQPFPGSDAALAFALVHVLVREGRVDRDFITRHTLGWNEIEGEIASMPPERASALTGIAVETIIAAARLYADGPSLLWLGQGVQRQRTGGNVVRAVSLLPIATGNIGKPGAGLLYMNGFESRGVGMDDLSSAHLRPADAPASVSHMDLAAHLLDASACAALFTWNNNIAASSPQQRRLVEALRRDDLFHVAIDLFPTDTTRFADIVLPAASFLEFDDLVVPYFFYDLSAQVKVREPPGEALPNQEIFRRLARAMNFDDAELLESDQEILARLMHNTNLGLSFADLARVGTVPYRPQAPVVPFAGLEFPTPSGRIEIASDRFVVAGTSRSPRAYSEERPRDGRLRILSPASAWLMNSSYANDDRIKSVLGEPTVTINPIDAETLGLSRGELAELVNETGCLKPLRVVIGDVVPVGTALVPKGRWPGLERSGANVNVLNAGEKSDLADATSVHSVEATLRRMSS
jgi:anaerobic selenocysteine-containing dehydrogenase